MQLANDLEPSHTQNRNHTIVKPLPSAYCLDGGSSTGSDSCKPVFFAKNTCSAAIRRRHLGNYLKQVDNFVMLERRSRNVLVENPRRRPEDVELTCGLESGKKASRGV